MTIPNGPVVTVPVLRETLGLPGVRLDGTRDVLAVLCGEAALPDDDARAWPLALGRWPETWLRMPSIGPRYMVALRGLANPYPIAGIWEVNPARWAREPSPDPSCREVPLRSPVYVAAAALTGRRLETGLTFGWLHPEEQFAFV
jgi:hypothetical protein